MPFTLSAVLNPQIWGQACRIGYQWHKAASMDLDVSGRVGRQR